MKKTMTKHAKSRIFDEYLNDFFVVFFLFSSLSTNQKITYQKNTSQKIRS